MGIIRSFWRKIVEIIHWIFLLVIKTKKKHGNIQCAANYKKKLQKHSCNRACAIWSNIFNSLSSEEATVACSESFKQIIRRRAIWCPAILYNIIMAMTMTTNVIGKILIKIKTHVCYLYLPTTSGIDESHFNSPAVHIWVLIENCCGGIPCNPKYILRIILEKFMSDLYAGIL